jgi:hypothetical protein
MADAAAPFYPRDVDPLPGSWQVPDDLRDLLSEYHLFQHSALMVCGGLRQDPVALYWAEHGLPAADRPLALRLPFPVAESGLLPHLAQEFFFLYACPTDRWPGLAQALALVAGSNGVRSWVSLRQDLAVPAWAGRPALLAWSAPEVVPASFYGLDGDREVVYFVPPPAGRSGPLRLTAAPPDKKGPT